jgi:DNA-binding beta-propeller fold protein YncE
VDRRSFLLAAAAAPAALHTATPRSYVTADLESHVAVVDVARGRVVRRIATPAGPRAIERVGERYVVAHTAIGAVSILGLEVLDEFDEPRYAAGTADGRYAFLTDAGSASLVAVDVVRGRVVGRTKLKQWPRHVSLAPDGRRLCVALSSASPEVAMVDVRDPRRPELVRYARAGLEAHDVGFAPSGRLWVTSGEARSVSANGRLLSVGSGPQHVTFAHGRAYVTSGVDGTLHVYEERTARLLRATRIPVGSYNVQHLGGGDVVTPSLNTGTLTVVGGAPVRVARSCHDAA